MSPSNDGKAQLQEFRPDDLPRIIETSTDDGLDRIGQMARDSIATLSKLPPGQARHEGIEAACLTIQDVEAEKRRRSGDAQEAQ